MSANANPLLETQPAGTLPLSAPDEAEEILNAIPEMFVEHDEHELIVRVNQAMAEFVGARRSELLGVSISAAIAFATGASKHPCVFCRAGQGDGRPFPLLERLYSISSSRVAAANDFVHTVHFLRDITDGYEAERRYRELLENLQEGMFFATPDGRFVEVNDALVRSLGYDSREELLSIDLSLELYFTREEAARFRSELNQAGSVREFHTVLRRKNGTPAPVIINAYVVRGAGGSIVQHRALVLNVSDVAQSPKT
jgi:PAS domain S-box-containing protein